MSDVAEAIEPDPPGEGVTQPTVPYKLRVLLEPHPYVVAYGGRFGLKTRSACVAALIAGMEETIRIFCGREVMRSIRESLHEELKFVIDHYRLGWFYTVMENEVRGRNGTRIFYGGLMDHTVESIKSLSNVDLALIDEANAVKKRSWDILLPTIRKPGARLWVLFNPGMADDDTYKRWVVDPLPGTVVVKTGWQDAEANGWFPEQENIKRLHFQKTQPKDYDNIWEGLPRSVVDGAIYTDEVTQMVEEQRFAKLPYNPMVPVDTIWDLGWNDAMVVIMAQKSSPTTVNIVNYLEVRGMRYDEVVGILEAQRYRWGSHWLPHDSTQHHPTSGTNAEKQLRKLFEGRGIIRVIPRSDPIARIQAARMMFPRVLMDSSTRTPPISPNGDAYLGAARLLFCLRRYKWNIPTTTGEATAPVHDSNSHAADSFGALAEIVDRIRSEFVATTPVLPAFSNSDPGMGTLR